MNREEIVALAEKAGFERLFPGNEDWVCFTEEIERFYKMVVAAEREALAKDSSVTEQPANQHESVATIIFGAKGGFADTPEWAYFNSSPANKPWVGLTEEERGQVYSDWRWNGSNPSNLELCQAIEAKLREKNA